MDITLTEKYQLFFREWDKAVEAGKIPSEAVYGVGTQLLETVLKKFSPEKGKYLHFIRSSIRLALFQQKYFYAKKCEYMESCSSDSLNPYIDSGYSDDSPDIEKQYLESNLIDHKLKSAGLTVEQRHLIKTCLYEQLNLVEYRDKYQAGVPIDTIRTRKKRSMYKLLNKQGDNNG